jgi:divalent metal cation (Fe/Co/Zn/Cd) transporter
MTITGLAVGSLIVGFAVLGLKTLAYWMTGSVALLSDARKARSTSQQRLPH